jgi:RNA polymerase sigma factor (sigma-70 family)
MSSPIQRDRHPNATPVSPSGDSQAATGQPCPIASLLVAHRPRLLACIQRRMQPGLKARLGAEDVLHEAYLAARRDFERNGRLPDVDAEFPWLFRAALDCIAEGWRRATAGRRDVRQDQALIDLSSLGFAPLDTGTGPVTASERIELNVAVHGAMAELKPEQREVLLLHGLDGLTLRETAQLLDITESNAGVRYVRAVQAFRRVWEERHPSGYGQ